MPHPAPKPGGSSTKAAWPRSATVGRASASTTSSPATRCYLTPFALADRPVTCGEWMSFMEDDGYRRPEFWLSDGWSVVMTQGWQAPLYWFRDGDAGPWLQFTLAGTRPVDPDEHRCAMSATTRQTPSPTGRGSACPPRRSGRPWPPRRPTGSNFLGPGVPHPRPAVSTNALTGDVWEWTSSAYTPYPGFRAAPGAVGEYNGKFMVSQYVLRGGCCATPPGHARADLPELLPTRSALGLQRCPTGTGSLTGHDLHDRRPPLARRRPPAYAGRCDQRPPGRPRSRSLRSGSTTSAAASSSSRSPHCPSTTPPGPSAPAGGTRTVHRRVVQGGHPGRARRGLVREDPGAPRRAAAARHPGPLRPLRRERRVPPRRRLDALRRVRRPGRPSGHR